MLRKMQERRSELFFMAVCFLLLGSVSVQGLFFEGERLGKLAQERAAEVERLKALDIMLCICDNNWNIQIITTTQYYFPPLPLATLLPCIATPDTAHSVSCLASTETSAELALAYW